MAGTVIEAALKITGQDAGASAMLAQVAANMKRVDEAAAHTEQVQVLGKRMAELKTQMEAVGQLKTAQANLAVMQERATTTAAATQHLKTEMAAVAAPTAAMTKAMEKAEAASFKANAAMLKQVEGIERQRKALAEMGVTANNAVHEQERLAKAFQDTARAAEIGMRAEQNAAKVTAQHAAATKRGAHGGGGHGGGFDLGGAVAGAVAAHSYIHAMEGVLETYREFDKEVRYQRLVMGLTPDQQRPLVEQAIHGGATSKFNDIQWLETQRELASRGYGKDQVMAFAPIAAQLATAFDVSMPQGVKALEGSLLGFHKDTTTMAAAMENAKRTADVQVKAAKIGGFGYEDVTQLYKYGAAPAQMAHLSEEQLLAFGVIAKKSNMNGDESGVAFRALAKNLISPTAGARTAMLANGIDYSKYQSAPQAIDLNAFGRDVATKYGVRLDHGTRAGLDKIFHDPTRLNDPARFAVAVTNLLRDKLGGDDAKSLKSIAKDAGAFRDASAGQVNANGLMTAIMEAIHKNPALANAIFGSKQGGRIAATLGDPELYRKILDEVVNQSKGYGAHVAEGRMEGFNGAVSKLDGAIMNFKSAIGRAIDNNGEKGTFTITHATELAAHLVQTLAETDPRILALGTAATGAGAMFGAVKLAGWFTGANALHGSAVALDSSAVALEAAAVRLGAGGAAGGAINAAESAAGGALGSLGWFGKLALGFGVGGAGLFVTDAMLNHRDHDKAMIEGGHPDPLTVNDNNLMLPGMDSGAASDTAEVTRRAADAATKAVGAWDWISAHAKALGFGDRLHADAPGAPLPPTRPDGLTLPAIVPPPEVADTFRTLPPAVRGAADALDRMKDREEKLKDDYGLTGFVMGQLNESAAKAALALASLAGIGGGSGSGGGGSGGGIINASWEGGDAGSGTSSDLIGGRVAPSIRRGRPHSVGGGGWTPSPDDPVFAGAKDASGFDWSRMGVQMGAKAAYMGGHLQANGASEFGAAAMLGHASVESNYKVNAFNGRLENSHGLFQWNDSAAAGHRWSKLKAWAAKNGRNPNDPLAQLDYAKTESMHMRGPHGMSVWDAMNHAGSLSEANHIWMDYFENPKVKDYGNRLNAGQHALSAMRSLKGKVPVEHPALAAPELRPRGPAQHDGAHLITARLEEKMERVATAVERGGLHRVHITADKSLKPQKTYSRGVMGMTTA